jgi:hypothetical protein
MYVYCVYPAMSKKSENLSDLNKKDRNKQPTNKLSWYPVAMYSEGADTYETGTNVTRPTKKTPLTTFMKGDRVQVSLIVRLGSSL